MSKILFILSRTDNPIAAYRPLIQELQKQIPNCKTAALSFCEFTGRQTDKSYLNGIFDSVYTFQDYMRPEFPRQDFGHWIMEIRIQAIQFFQENQFDLIIFHNDRSAHEYETSRIVKRLNIPSVLVQEALRKDHVIQPQPDEARVKLFGMDYSALSHGQGFCDLVFAWGEGSRRYFREVGVADDRIITSGYPRMDEFVTSFKKLKPKKLRKGLGLSNDHVVLFAGNPIYRMGLCSKKEYFDQLRLLHKVVSETNHHKLQLLFKPHPSEVSDLSNAGIIDLFQAGPKTKVLDDTPINEALAVADVVLLNSSTIALEAMLVDIPFFILNLNDWQLGDDYNEQAAGGLIENEADIIPAITEGPFVKPKADVIDYYLSHRGSSAKYTAAVLQERFF